MKNMKHSTLIMGVILMMVTLLTLGACKDEEGEATPDLSMQLQEGLVLHTPFDGNAEDMVSGQAGALEGGVTFTEDRNGEISRAVYFSGSTYVEFPSRSAFNFGNTQDFTISAFVNPDEQPDNGSFSNDIVAKWCKDGSCSQYGYPFSVRINFSEGEQDLRFVGGRFRSNECEQGNSIGTDEQKVDQWYHIVFQKKSTLLYYYLNGVLVATKDDDANDTSGGCSTQNAAPLRFGTRNPEAGTAAGRSYFKGSLDDVRIYNRALTEEEIEFLSNN